MVLSQRRSKKRSLAELLREEEKYSNNLDRYHEHEQHNTHTILVDHMPYAPPPLHPMQIETPGEMLHHNFPPEGPTRCGWINGTKYTRCIYGTRIVVAKVLRGNVDQLCQLIKDTVVDQRIIDNNVFDRRLQSILAQPWKWTDTNTAQRFFVWRILKTLNVLAKLPADLKQDSETILERAHLSVCFRDCLAREVLHRKEMAGKGKYSTSDTIKNHFLSNNTEKALKSCTDVKLLRLGTLISQGIEVFRSDENKANMIQQTRLWASDGTLELMDPELANIYMMFRQTPQLLENEPLKWMYALAWNLWSSEDNVPFVEIWKKTFTDEDEFKSPAFFLLKFFVSRQLRTMSLELCRELLNACCFRNFFDVSLAWEVHRTLPLIFSTMMQRFDERYPDIHNRLDVDMTTLLDSLGLWELAVEVSAQYSDVVEMISFQHESPPEIQQSAVSGLFDYVSISDTMDTNWEGLDKIHGNSSIGRCCLLALEMSEPELSDKIDQRKYLLEIQQRSSDCPKRFSKIFLTFMQLKMSFEDDFDTQAWIEAYQDVEYRIVDLQSRIESQKMLPNEAVLVQAAFSSMLETLKSLRNDIELFSVDNSLERLEY